jgi:hypothetical protein
MAIFCRLFKVSFSVCVFIRLFLCHHCDNACYFSWLFFLIILVLCAAILCQYFIQVFCDLMRARCILLFSCILLLRRCSFLFIILRCPFIPFCCSDTGDDSICSVHYSWYQVYACLVWLLIPGALWVQLWTTGRQWANWCWICCSVFDDLLRVVWKPCITIQCLCVVIDTDSFVGSFPSLCLWEACSFCRVL